MDNLNHNDKSIRLAELEKLIKITKRPEPTGFVNNHIHTFYSFSPYSPTKAVWMAYNAGLDTAGIMDHDTIAGAKEFIEAGKIAGMATTIGIECRTDCSGTELFGKRINNPDQESVAYMAIHGIPHTMVDKVTEFFTPYLEARNRRNRFMTKNLNDYVSKFSLSIDYEKDVIPLSKKTDGGSVTERHILFALSNIIIKKFGKGMGTVDFIKDKLGIYISEKIEGFLADVQNPYYEYDLLGVLKSDLVERFYVNATDECPKIREVVSFAKQISAIPAYAYLGDISNSVTGDKKAQKFEDDYIELLFKELADIGFLAVTYMPSRNTKDQLIRLKDLCRKYKLFEISGEDINTPRQLFICPAMKDPLFDNLTQSTWALIGQEFEATKDLEKGMFCEASKKLYPDFDKRISEYAKFGKNSLL
jgi:hypothetical protein